MQSQNSALDRTLLLTRGRVLLASIWLSAVMNTAPAVDSASPFFEIHIVDEDTGRGVPLVELRTVHNVPYLTDSLGLVAFDEPGLMGQPVFFNIRSHGYEYRKDGFGYAGATLHPVAGTRVELKIKRINIAERLYRVTGGGIYRDTILLGKQAPTAAPLLNAQVLGQDSVMAVPWRDQIYWFWGDTSRPKYPLGQFQTSGATSEIPARGGLQPAVGINLRYFTNTDGFSRPMCPLAESGLVWIDGLSVVRDQAGREQMLTHYARMKSLGEMLEHGVAVFDPEANLFRKKIEFDLKQQWRCPRGHPLRQSIAGTDYLLFPAPYPTVRARAQWQSLLDPASYEAFTCVKPGNAGGQTKLEVERGADGHLVYSWRTNAAPISSEQERELIQTSQIQPQEARFQLHDAATGKPVELHGGSIYWNDYRKKWILVGVQAKGDSSYLGEVWFAEAVDPTGPWQRAHKIVTHEKYTFYNPTQHPFFDEDGGRIIYFEGTYANTFSGNPEQTPRYDYNQIMYRLDLSDPRLALP